MNLAELVRMTKGDRTYEQLSTDCGGEPTSQRLQQIAAGKPVREFLKVPTIRYLANGLGVSQRVVVLAIAESAGLDVEPSAGLASLLPPSADTLTERQVATILQLVAVLNDSPPTPHPELKVVGGDVGDQQDSDRGESPAELKKRIEAAFKVYVRLAVHDAERLDGKDLSDRDRGQRAETRARLVTELDALGFPSDPPPSMAPTVESVAGALATGSLLADPARSEPAGDQGQARPVRCSV